MHILVKWEIIDQDHRQEKKDTDRSKIDQELETVTMDHILKIEIATTDKMSIFTPRSMMTYIHDVIDLCHHRSRGKDRHFSMVAISIFNI